MPGPEDVRQILAGLALLALLVGAVVAVALWLPAAASWAVAGLFAGLALAAVGRRRD